MLWSSRQPPPSRFRHTPFSTINHTIAIMWISLAYRIVQWIVSYCNPVLWNSTHICTRLGCHKVIYLKGIAFKNIWSGFGPEVYLAITKGSKICNGVIGIAKKARLSLWTPAAISFNPTAFSYANPIYVEKEWKNDRHKLTHRGQYLYPFQISIMPRNRPTCWKPDLTVYYVNN